VCIPGCAAATAPRGERPGMQAPAVRIRGRCDTSTNLDCNRFHLTPCPARPPASRTRSRSGAAPGWTASSEGQRAGSGTPPARPYPQGHSRNVSLVLACRRRVGVGAGDAHRNAVRRPDSGRCAWPDGCREDHLDDRRHAWPRPQPTGQPAPLLGAAPNRTRLGTVPSRPARRWFAASRTGPLVAVD
jgi:hypothetical protein